MYTLMHMYVYKDTGIAVDKDTDTHPKYICLLYMNLLVASNRKLNPSRPKP